MLTLDLPRLEREGSLSFEARIPDDAPLWEGSDIRFEGDVLVRGHASLAGSGEIVVRLRVEGVQVGECKRCLDPVHLPLDRQLTLVFGAPDDEVDDDADSESDMRIVADEVMTLELGEVLREELILGTDRWVLCRPDCRGICPFCGVDRNEDTCDCSPDESDPRWDALRGLKTE